MQKNDLKKTREEESELSRAVRQIGGVVAVVVTIGNIIAGWFNLNVASQLSPLRSDINQLKIEVQAAQKQHDTFVSKDSFSALKDVVDKIDRNVTTIINSYIR